MKNKILKIILAIIILLVSIFLINFFINKYSVPNKEERINDMIIYKGNSLLTGEDIANEISIMLNKYTNWDNLFISENFKKKFKNKKDIIENINEYSSFSVATDYFDENVVILYGNRKKPIFDNDESDDITTEFYFKYKINNNEIDDLILIKQNETYTIDGSPIYN